MNGSKKVNSTSGLTRRSMLRKGAAGLTAAAFSSMGVGSAFAQVAASSHRTQGRDERVVVALVGGQHVHTPNFVRRMANNEGIRTKYVWDSNADTARRRQEVVGGDIVDDVQTIYDDPEVEAVVVCSQTVRHQELVPPAAAAGKHLFVEKPLGMNGEQAERLARAINEAGVIFQTGFFMRSNPRNMFIRDLIQNGTLGTVTRLRLSNCHGGALAGWFDEEWRWMADRERSGVGGFGDLGAHAVDLLLWFTDGDPVERCTAHVDAAVGRYPDIDEYGEGMVEFASGAVATVAAGWVDVADPNTIEVAGTEGHLRVTRNQLFIRSDNLEGADGETPWTDLPPERPHAFVLFLQAIQGEDVPLVSANEAAMGNKVITAMYAGANQKTWISPA